MPNPGPPKTEHNEPSQAGPEQLKEVPKGYRPWEDRSLPPEERFEAYKEHVAQQVLAMIAAAEKLADAEFHELKSSPATQELLAHAEELAPMAPEEFCWRADGGLHREILGENFLGAEAWKSQGIDVGFVPMIPWSITEQLLNSDCPLIEYAKMRDTHLLMLLPKTVNGEQYSAVKLDQLWTERKGAEFLANWSGYGWKLCSGPESQWKGTEWANAPQVESEWVLIPKADPDFEAYLPDKKCFRELCIPDQEQVHADYYGEYRAARTLEVMTAVLLRHMTNNELIHERQWLRCQESNAIRGRIQVGFFSEAGLQIETGFSDYGDTDVGFAIARKV